LSLRRSLHLLMATLSPAWITAALATDPLPEHYAESVMIFALSADGTEEVSVRLARFPDRGRGTVWLHVADRDGAWSLADDSFELVAAGATPVRADTATFAARREAAAVTFESLDRNTERMHGSIQGTLRAAKTRHPEPYAHAHAHADAGAGTGAGAGADAGSEPVSFDLAFHADSPGFRSQTNRWELVGRIVGTISLPGRTIAFDHAGKWHEQTGPRMQFAPAFTYFNIQGDGLAMLVVALDDRVDGYALVDGRTLGIRSFEIDHPGLATRRFRTVLTDDRVVEGAARVVQTWSVPIEGRRRPGTSVLVDSNVGPLLGTLNDWDPQG